MTKAKLLSDLRYLIDSHGPCNSTADWHGLQACTLIDELESLANDLEKSMRAKSQQNGGRKE